MSCFTSRLDTPHKQIIFGNRSQNIRESRYQSFLVLCNFASFSYFMLYYFVTDCRDRLSEEIVEID